MKVVPVIALKLRDLIRVLEVLHAYDALFSLLDSSRTECPSLNGGEYTCKVGLVTITQRHCALYGADSLSIISSVCRYDRSRVAVTLLPLQIISC